MLGNQPGMYAALDALDWENTQVAAATSEISRGRIETRTIRVLPAPEDRASRTPARPILLERYVVKKTPLASATRGRPLRHQPTPATRDAASPTSYAT